MSRQATPTADLFRNTAKTVLRTFGERDARTGELDRSAVTITVPGGKPLEVEAIVGPLRPEPVDDLGQEFEEMVTLQIVSNQLDGLSQPLPDRTTIVVARYGDREFVPTETGSKYGEALATIEVARAVLKRMQPRGNRG